MSEAIGGESSRYELGLDRDGNFTMQLTEEANFELLRERYQAFVADLDAATRGRQIQIPPRAIQPEQGEE